MHALQRKTPCVHQQHGITFPTNSCTVPLLYTQRQESCRKLGNPLWPLQGGGTPCGHLSGSEFLLVQAVFEHSVSDSYIVVEWVPPSVAAVSRYHLQIRLCEPGATWVTVSRHLPGTETRCMVQMLQPLTSYQFRIRAHPLPQDWPWSNFSLESLKMRTVRRF